MSKYDCLGNELCIGDRCVMVPLTRAERVEKGFLIGTIVGCNAHSVVFETDCGRTIHRRANQIAKVFQPSIFDT